MNTSIKILGGNKLKGSVEPIPNKNSLMAVLPAAILSSEDIVYKNVPRTTDVQIHLDILKDLGANVDDLDYSNITINTKKVEKSVVESPQASRLRASIMYVGPLLARFGHAKVPLPGGCLLGARSIHAHIEVFKKLGSTVELNEEFVEFNLEKNNIREHTIWMREASVTATENALLYAAMFDGNITLYNCACEPHVSDLAKLLIEMGAVIEGVGSNKMTIIGSRNLSSAEYIPTPDPVDITGYIVAAAITDGEIEIKGANQPEIVGGLISYFEPFNVIVKKDNSNLLVKRKGDLRIDWESSGFPLAGKDLPKFNPGPWPNFPVDSLPAAVTLATKTKGKILMQNWMYESGFSFTTVLSELGANIFISDPQRVIVEGPCTYKGGEVTTPRVIQACKAVFLAALADPVETVIHGTDVLYRRYPDIINVYRSLGAEIEIL